jgi:hypothetical protein
VRWNTSAGAFTLKPQKLPAYFAQPFTYHRIASHNKPDYYDYVPSPGVVDFWVDFANVYLGGGVFDEGFVQEEIMCCEMPELANAAAIKVVSPNSALITRDPAGNTVLAGSPNPLVLTPVYRTIAISTDLYGRAIGQFSGDINQKLTKLQTQTPLNILAMAAPTLKVGNYKPWDVDTVHDLFNTFMAGFTLAKTVAAGNNPLINTGKIGCGDFKNDPTLVYILQLLAAEQLGLNLMFWGYKNNEAEQAYGKYKTLAADTTPRSVVDLLQAVAALPH